MSAVERKLYIDQAESDHRTKRLEYWEEEARRSDKYKGLGRYYHERLSKIYKSLVMPGEKVVEIGCGTGDLLAALEPSVGLGIDFAEEMIDRARKRYPDLRFIRADVHDLSLLEKFDVVILSDLVNDLWDVQTVLERVLKFVNPNARIIINTYSRLWEAPLGIARGLGLARPVLNQNWLTVDDISGLLNLANFEVLRSWPEILWPVRTPLIASIVNRYAVRLWPFKHLALTNFIVARPNPQPKKLTKDPIVSVIVAARNEEGNIKQIFERVPEMGGGTELIFVEGNSTDDTWAAIQKEASMFPYKRCRALQQTGIGKGDAVRLGFSEASGDILMILDADLTVPPEDLPRFYEAIRSGKGDFINGIRLVYPMQDQAMRFFNLLGNKFFSMAFSWLLGQPIKDSLCGTKVLWKSDYNRLAANRSYFGDFDPFGDFDLLFGAARLNMKIVEMPIRYRERTYGTTNIQRWKHGWMLLKMVLFAASKIKFI